MTRKKTQTALSQSEDVRAQRRALAVLSFLEFIRLVQPRRMLGNIHLHCISWIQSEGQSHKLLLLPRDHQKSAIAGLYAAWRVTRDPTIRILYISSTSNLATKQLKFIKDILTSDNYRLYWPEMVEKEEAKREKWTEREISVDHPLRKEAYVRDPTIWTAGLTTNIVGMHCDLSILDDVVVSGNAYTEDSREKVKNQYSLLSSIEGTNAQQLVVGTRYHPNDLYSSLLELTLDQYDELGSVKESKPLFQVEQYQVESAGDGTGEFLWPKMRAPDGRWYGFDAEILARKRSTYQLSPTQFRAQYYNDPSDTDSSPIKRDLFQYYDMSYLSRRDGMWFFKGDKLNVVAAVDFAYSTGKKSDASSIVVVGCDHLNNYYVLDIDRFKTDKISDYFDHILKLYEKWGFRKIRAEVSVAQAVIVKDLKENYIRPYGLALSVDEFRPSRWLGSKEERILAVLEPKYSNGQIWHYQAGNIQVLEEELIFTNPPHDDVKDALASAIDFAVPPTNFARKPAEQRQTFTFNSRWGGVA